jgi:phosphate transport system substrate-binding protein
MTMLDLHAGEDHGSKRSRQSIKTHPAWLIGPLVSVLMTGILLTTPAVAADILGAGATFPYPVYAKWAEAYKLKTGIGMNYQSIGSGGGIKQIEAGTVDFGASDMPLKPDVLKAAGLVQFPMIMGGVVPVVNLDGIQPGQIKLTGVVLADIFAGKIARWDDPAIKSLNADVTLPAQAIAVVHRSDGSGTTFIFTNYLAKVSPTWEKTVGVNTAVDWPTGLGGKGNEGIAATVGQTKGAIGYVEYAYALQTKMTHVSLQTHDGQFLQPGSQTFQSAASNADWAKAQDYYLILTDQPGAQSWPITGASFILMHQKQDKPETARQVLTFFDWAYHNGGAMAAQLDYVPMPDQVVSQVEKGWAHITDANGTSVWTAPQTAAGK